MKPLIPLRLTLDNDTPVTVAKVSVTYLQEGEDHIPSELTIETDDLGAGPFFVMKTSSEGWAFATAEELSDVINDFRTRCGMET